MNKRPMIRFGEKECKTNQNEGKRKIFNKLVERVVLLKEKRGVKGGPVVVKVIRGNSSPKTTATNAEGKRESITPFQSSTVTNGGKGEPSKGEEKKRSSQ